jgi:hypothetical protein
MEYMFAGHHTDKPRSRYTMDFQGQGQAIIGETEALAIMDSFTKTVSVIALPNREAATLAPRLLDETFFAAALLPSFTATKHRSSCRNSSLILRLLLARLAPPPADTTHKNSCPPLTTSTGRLSPNEFALHTILSLANLLVSPLPSKWTSALPQSLLSPPRYR